MNIIHSREFRREFENYRKRNEKLKFNQNETTNDITRVSSFRFNKFLAKTKMIHKKVQSHCKTIIILTYYEVEEINLKQEFNPCFIML